ncbi:MAG: hypothetical protein EOM91_21000 [Sphingobacteriia bacterium]|nr:hypothetical protein [Sphingobacteriia bacterium]
MTTDLVHQLNPTRFPGMSPLMGAIVGYLLGEKFTVPSIAELTVSPDGGVIVVPVDADGRRQHPVFIGTVAELRANVSRLGMTAKLDDEQWRELADRVRLRLGIVLEHGADADPTLN